MNRIFTLIILASSPLLLFPQDTFSIVAVDTITGEIGSAGASCIDETQITGGAYIISDVIPDRGAIHTQSYWDATNQQNAHDRMMEGMNPQEIIDWLVAHDVSNNPAVRQYGIVDFDSNGHARSAAFTGSNCLNYKNHITGPNYSIQGNILLGQQVLDSIQARFLNTEGELAVRLMSALQGAKIPGADSRCLSNGTSSLSAFIRVAHPGDVPGSFYCDLNVPSVPTGMEPIDSLQILFDLWLNTTVGISDKSINEQTFRIYPNPANSALSVEFLVFSDEKDVEIAIFDLTGRTIEKFRVKNRISRVDISFLQDGIYLVALKKEDKPVIIEKFVKNGSD